VTLTTPIQGTVSYHKARTSHGQPVYKLAVPANLTASHGVQNSKMSHVTLTMPLSGIIITIIIMVYLLLIFHQQDGTGYGQPIYQI